MIPLMAPIYVMGPIISEPDGDLARLMSFIPFTTPVTMIMRLGAADIALIEIIGSLMVTVPGGVVLLWGSARVFRAGC